MELELSWWFSDLRFCAPSSGDEGSIPGQGTRSHMLQPRPSAAKEITHTVLKNNKKKMLGASLLGFRSRLGPSLTVGPWQENFVVFLCSLWLQGRPLPCLSLAPWCSLAHSCILLNSASSSHGRLSVCVLFSYKDASRQLQDSPDPGTPSYPCFQIQSYSESQGDADDLVAACWSRDVTA